jgi:serine protease
MPRSTHLKVIIAAVATLATLAASSTAAAASARIPIRPGAHPTRDAHRLPVSPRIEQPIEDEDLESDEGGSSPSGSSSDYMVYRGGWIQESPRIYIVYWGNWSLSNDIYNVGGRLYSFLLGIGGSSFASLLTGYGYNCTVGGMNCPSGVMFKNPAGQLRNWWYDTSYVPTQPTTSDLQAETQRAAAHFGDYDHNAQYVIALPPHHGDFRFPGLCAWHGWAPVNAGVGAVSFTSLNYMPDAGVGRCGNNSVTGSILDGVTIIEGHEYAESVTNPYISYAGPSAAEGWNDSTFGSGEIGDKCMGVGGFRNSTFSTGTFPVQSLWSNYYRYYYNTGCMFG